MRKLQSKEKERWEGLFGIVQFYYEQAYGAEGWKQLVTRCADEWEIADHAVEAVWKLAKDAV